MFSPIRWTPAVFCNRGPRHSLVRVLNYLEVESRVRGGIVTAARQQRRALAGTDIEVVQSPWRAGDPIRSIGTAMIGKGYFEDYDIAHCNLIGPGSLAVARYARRTDVPLVLHAHVTAEDFAESFRFSTHLAPLLRPYLRRFYSQADVVLCPSQYTRGVLEGYPISAPIRPVTNGVDLDSLAGFETFRDEYRERYDLDGTVVFAVGEVFERKGLSTFCKLARDTDYRFVWFGAYSVGPFSASSTRHWIRNPPENLTFTGYVPDKRGMFAAGDIYLFPAKTENQGIAVLEAMACGKACILRDIPVFREFYTDGEDCLLCGSFAEFRSALDRVAGDPDLRKRLGENARETARTHGLDRVREELLAAYADVSA